MLLAALAVSAGQAIFAGKGGCVACHSVGGRGGSVGPDLSMIGLTRTTESLRLALVDPDAEIYREYLSVEVTTRRGETVTGIALNEDDLSVQVRDAAGNPRAFLKEDLAGVRRLERSLMPSFATRLTAAELDGLVAYLRTLRGSRPTGPAPPREPSRVAESTAWLTRPDRDADERPDTLLRAIRIPQGATVADVGAGLGYFTPRLSRAVGPAGHVVAVDLQQEMLDRIGALHLSNVSTVLGGESDPRLAAQSVEWILLANSYHEFAQPALMLAALRRALKPGGCLVILEYKQEDASLPISPSHRMTIRQLRAEVETAGFTLERILDFLPIQHGLVFTVQK
jgi:putative heme-binding domain-containing protein